MFVSVSSMCRNGLSIMPGSGMNACLLTHSKKDDIALETFKKKKKNPTTCLFFVPLRLKKKVPSPHLIPASSS